MSNQQPARESAPEVRLRLAVPWRRLAPVNTAAPEQAAPAEKEEPKAEEKSEPKAEEKAEEKEEKSAPAASDSNPADSEGSTKSNNGDAEIRGKLIQSLLQNWIHVRHGIGLLRGHVRSWDTFVALLG